VDHLDSRYALMAVLPWVLGMMQICCLGTLTTRWRACRGVGLGTVIVDLVPGGMIMFCLVANPGRDLLAGSIIRCICMLGVFAGYRFGSLHWWCDRELRKAERWHSPAHTHEIQPAKMEEQLRPK
jgi:hypothetical protein